MTKEKFYEGCGCESLIRCIFLSEFHPIAGSKITCQIPEGYVSKEVFDAINVYIIPKLQLQRCTLTVNVLGYKVLGYPVKIDSPRYARNAFYFNLCLVTDAWARSVQYEPIVKKLSNYLTMMEEETGFLSKDEEDKCLLKRLLINVLNKLNACKTANIIEADNTIFLSIAKIHSDPPPSLAHTVPMINANYLNVVSEIGDLTTKQILPYINGINHIKRIAVNSQVEVNLVRTCILNLKYYGIVHLMPIFKFSNVYMCTRALRNLTKDINLQQCCRKYICLNNELGCPTWQNIFRFYCSLSHGITLKNICQRLNPQNHNIDVKKLIVFGLQYKFIRSINKYPVFIGSFPTGKQKLYTGALSFDEICCRASLSPSYVEDDIEYDTNVTVIWK